MRRAFDMYAEDTDDQAFKYLNVFARIEKCKKWKEVRKNLANNKGEQYNPDDPAPAASVGRPELGQNKLKELRRWAIEPKSCRHPSTRLGQRKGGRCREGPGVPDRRQRRQDGRGYEGLVRRPSPRHPAAPVGCFFIRFDVYSRHCDTGSRRCFRRPMPRQTRLRKGSPMSLLSSSFSFDRRNVADPFAELWRCFCVAGKMIS
jgi:hypothetical protein